MTGMRNEPRTPSVGDRFWRSNFAAWLVTLSFVAGAIVVAGGIILVVLRLT